MAEKAFVFKYRGRTVGKSGREYRFEAGQPVIADESEFAHVDKSDYQIASADEYRRRPMTPAAPGSQDDQADAEEEKRKRAGLKKALKPAPKPAGPPADPQE